MRVYDNTESCFDIRTHGAAFIADAIPLALAEEFRSIVDDEYDCVKNPKSELALQVAESTAKWGGIAFEDAGCQRQKRLRHAGRRKAGALRDGGPAT